MCLFRVCATKRNQHKLLTVLLSLLTSDKPVPHICPRPCDLFLSSPLLSLYPTYRHSHAALKGLLVALYLSVESAVTSVRRSIPLTLSVPCDVIILLFPLQSRDKLRFLYREKMDNPVSNLVFYVNGNKVKFCSSNINVKNIY